LWANKKTPTFLRASAKTSFTRDSLNKNMYNANIQKKLNMEDKKYTKKNAYRTNDRRRAARSYRRIG
jgi:hypothetical protein